LNPTQNFRFFIAAAIISTYKIGILEKLADNELYGCRTVVQFNVRKWGHFWMNLCSAQCTKRLKEVV